MIDTIKQHILRYLNFKHKEIKYNTDKTIILYRTKIRPLNPYRYDKTLILNITFCNFNLIVFRLLLFHRFTQTNHF